MLKIINDLEPFFEDNYRRIHVREFAKLQKISPPTASKRLESLNKENLIKKEIDKQYYYYFANKDSFIFKDLQRIYWKEKLEKVGLIEEITNQTFNPTIILFGSLAKAEAKVNSDIDLAIITISSKELDLRKFEKKLNKEIQIFKFKTINDIPLELKNNILDGYKIT